MRGLQQVVAALLASAILLAVMGVSLYVYASSISRSPGVPAPSLAPLRLSATQLVTCSGYVNVSNPSYTLLLPSGMRDELKLSIYSPLEPVNVSAVVPDTPGAAALTPRIEVPGGSERVWNASLGSIGAVTFKAMPGDVATVASATVRIDSGAVAVYRGGVLPRGVSGACPVGGYPVTAPLVTGAGLAVVSSGSVCAPGVLATPQASKALVVAVANPASFLCSRDVPFFVALAVGGDSLAVGQTGDYRLAVYLSGRRAAAYAYSSTIIIWYDGGSAEVLTGSGATYTAQLPQGVPTILAGVAKACPGEGEVSDTVPFLGVFKDRYIYIEGTYPGDEVVVRAGDYEETVTATGPEVVIDALSIPPQQLATALENGGITVTVVPSREHLQYMLPTGFWVHAETQGADGWYYVQAPLLLQCPVVAYVHSTAPVQATLVANNFVLWSATLGGRRLGVFGKAIVAVKDGYVVLSSRYGVYSVDAGGGTLVVNTGPGSAVVVRTGPVVREYRYVTSVTVVGRRYMVALYPGR